MTDKNPIKRMKDFRQDLEKVCEGEIPVDELGYYLNMAVGTIMQSGGAVLAITGLINKLNDSEPLWTNHPIRDGVLIYAAGTVMKAAIEGVQYLKALYPRK